MKTLWAPDAAAGDRRAVGVSPYVAEKMLRQAGRLPLARRRALLERMLLADVRGKTGEREIRVELELVVVEIVKGADKDAAAFVIVDKKVREGK